MPKRRGHGEGAIYQRKEDGLWCAMVNLGWIDGKRKRKIIYGKTRKEVADKLKGVLHDQQQGLPIQTKHQTVGQFLDRWLADTVQTKNRPKTFHSYSQMVRLHLLPALGKIVLDKLTPQEVDRLLQRKRTEGLSARTRQYLRGILRAALNQALRWGLVSRNVAVLTDPPKVERFITHPLTPPQAQTLLQAARGDRLETLYSVALWLGLRQGEILALHWEDVDLETRTLRVEATLQSIGGETRRAAPKTANSRRTITLPAALVQSLQAHRVRQLEERLRVGQRWVDHGLIFCTSVGTPMSARNLVRSFKALLVEAGLPDIRFHDLRHSCASLLAANGVPARVAMDVLGHANITTTQNIYTHVFDDAKRQAADVMDQLFGGSGGADQRDSRVG